MNGGAQNVFLFGLGSCQMLGFAFGGLTKYIEQVISQPFLAFCHHFATLSLVRIPMGNRRHTSVLLSGVPFVD
jgi:hypothetical protein